LVFVEETNNEENSYKQRKNISLPLELGRPGEPALDALLAEERRLEAQVQSESLAFSGLKDLDTALALIETKLRIALHQLELLADQPSTEAAAERRAAAAGKSSQALGLLEELLSENLSEDQNRMVMESPGYERVRGLFQGFLLQGGAALLSRREEEQRNSRLVARAMAAALRKHLPPSDWECGIEEGQEVLYSSRRMRLPLSQAVLYLEQVMLPELVRRLAGKRICPELDRDLRFRKSLQSGRCGSSRLPRFKLDLKRGFSALKALYPALHRLEDKRELAGLIELVRSAGRGAAQKAIEALLAKAERPPPLLP